jgi:hypothetical protein
MTVDSSNMTDRAPGWFVHTDKGVTLSPRFDARDAAQTAYWDVVAELRREMAHNHRSRASIEEHIAAVRVGYGVLVGAWEGFEPLAEP